MSREIWYVIDLYDGVLVGSYGQRAAADASAVERRREGRAMAVAKMVMVMSVDIVDRVRR